MSIAAAMLGLGVGCSASQVVPSESRAETIQLLARAWQSADPVSAGELAAPGALATKTRLSSAAENIGLLGLQDVGVSAVDGSPDRLRITWRIPELEPSANSTTVRVVWADSPTGTRVVSLGSDGGVIPLWLLEPLSIKRAPHLMVVGGVGLPLDDVLLQSKQAQQRVKRSLPEWDGRLVVEAPSSQGLLEASLASELGTYDSIAAVASSSDGSVARDVAHRVLLNPGVYSEMESAAARLVLTHEVVHVATRASSVRVPVWWAEGFAEYVAFASAEDSDIVAVKLRVQAGEQLADALVATGIPRDLPSVEEFRGSSLEAAYEASRRACVVLADLAESKSRGSSMASLGAFQRELSEGATVEEAMQAIFDISYQGFLTRWRAELSQSTNGVP